MNPKNYHELKTGDVAILNEAQYDISLPTIIFAHGFTMNGHKDEKILRLRDGKLLNNSQRQSRSQNNS